MRGVTAELGRPRARRRAPLFLAETARRAHLFLPHDGHGGGSQIRRACSGGSPGGARAVRMARVRAGPVPRPRVADDRYRAIFATRERERDLTIRFTECRQFAIQYPLRTALSGTLPSSGEDGRRRDVRRTRAAAHLMQLAARLFLWWCTASVVVSLSLFLCVCVLRPS